MAFDATDWTITRSSGDIRYIGDAHAGTAPTYATGIEFHRALMDFADQGGDTGDDELAIIDNVPSARGGVDTNITLLNGFNIDQTASEHLYDTSISQGAGAVIYDGIQVFGNAVSIQVIQDGARITNDFWNEAKMIAAVEDTASSTTHRFLVLVRTASADIDDRKLLGTQRVYGTVYTEFSIGGGTNRGNNVLALTANSNLNNATAEGTIATYTDIVNDNEGYSQIDADGNTVDENYYSNWELAARSKNDFYERAQWLQREGSVSTLYGLNGDIFRGITHSVAITPGTGTWVEPESLSWGSGATAGTGQLLATDDTDATATSIIYIQLLSGVAPSANLITGNGSATGTAGAVVSKLLSLPFVGASTGSALIGAYGLGIGADDLVVADSVTALDGTPRNPPNNVTFSVTGLDITGGEEDYVLVGPESGGVLDLAQDTLNGALTSGTTTAVVMTTAIPTDTPSSGTIRIENDEGRYVRIPYSSYTGSTYTIPSYDFSGTGDNDSCADLNNVFISYIDKAALSTTESVVVVFDSSRNLIVRVRNGNTATPAVNPIVPFEALAILGSAGGSQAASRVLDL
ncbi:MAG: hypothetical protein ACTSYX_11920 [Candidatus Thorarchaeota archaeon]